jgi:hypothetical protein
MTVKTITTKAIIEAQDQTGATFAQIAKKLQGMEAQAASAGKRLQGAARIAKARISLPQKRGLGPPFRML